MFAYPVTLDNDDGPGFAVTCRDIPELNSYGDTIEKALSEARAGIESALSIYVDQRRPIPLATTHLQGEHIVLLPTLTIAKIALWNTMVEQGLRRADLCRLLSIHQAQGDRLIDFLHSSKIEQVENALEVLGKRLVVNVQTA